jgi:hypothetical protein
LQSSKSTKEDILPLSIGNNCILKWYLDASFAVHEDMKSHTRAVMTLGEEIVQVTFTEQKKYKKLDRS